MTGDRRFASPLRAVEQVIVSGGRDGLTLWARKRVTATDPYMAGHFPDFTIFPGVFILEGLRQAVIAALGESAGRLPEIRALQSIRFLAPLLPGDDMTLEATVEPSSDTGGFAVDAHCRRGDGVTAARLKVEFGYGGISSA